MRGAINFVWRLSVIAELGLAVRLLWQGLAGHYPALFTAACLLPVKSSLLMLAYLPGVPHAQMRQTAQRLGPLEWLVSAWIVYELFSLWSRNYPGSRRFGRILMVNLLGVALLISFAGWQIEWDALSFAQNFRIYYILDRVVWGTLAIFVAGTWLFFRDYPVKVAPNLVHHTHIAVVYFVATAFSLLSFTLNGLKYVAQVNFMIVTVTAGCFTAWAILLTREGQRLDAT